MSSLLMQKQQCTTLWGNTIHVKIRWTALKCTHGNTQFGTQLMCLQLHKLL